MTRARTLPQARRGAILLVVVSLLTLFAVVGLSFVLYADAEAMSARFFREAGTQARPDLDPELLFAHFLGQLMYDTPNDDTGVYSAMRGHSLARGIYGSNDTPGAANLVPFNGVGRLRDVPGWYGGNDFGLINYTYHPADGTHTLRTPEKYRLGTDLVYTGGFNAPYTYPDLNNVVLAAVRGADGAVLLPSFHRPWTGAGDFYHPQSGQLNPAWAAGTTLPMPPLLKYQTLRPLPALHPGFPAPEDGGGDVKNLIGGPGTFRRINPATGQPEFWNNDSIWMDLDFPVMTAPDGRKYKPLFAALVTDLDNRVNVNVHGNVAGDKFHHRSNQGWGPWEVNLEKVLGGGAVSSVPEWSRLFHGADATAGRYGPDRLPTSRHPGNAAPALLRPHFHSQVDFDGRDESGRNGATALWQLPLPALPGGVRFAYPMYPQGYGNSSVLERIHHPVLFDPFTPRVGVQPGNHDRTFALSNMEALLRYGDTGSPALTADMYRLSPTGFRNPASRRLVTTLSMDLDRPGAAPWLFHPDLAPYATPPTDLDQLGVPRGQPFNFPDPTTRRNPLTDNSEFAGADWRSRIASLGRLNLNRPLPPYPHMGSGKSPPFGPPLTGSTGSVALDIPFHVDAPSGPIWKQFLLAHEARQRLANDLYRRLLLVTGVAPIRPEQLPQEPPPEMLRTRRWLAQLAANIVDYLDEDDLSTPLCFYTAEDYAHLTVTPLRPPDPGRVASGRLPDRPDSAGEIQWPLYWVFGTELPRVVLNEALAEMRQNDPNDAYQDTVRVFVELHNTFPRTVPAAAYQPDRFPVPLRMQGPTPYAPYRVVVSAKSPRRLQPTEPPLAIHPGVENDNVLGNPNADSVRRMTTDGDFSNPLETIGGDRQPEFPGADGYRGMPSPHLPAHGPDTATLPQGCLLLGPPANGPPEFAPFDPFARGGVPAATPVLRSRSLEYEHFFPALGPTDPPDERVTGTVVLLRRLANPYLPFDGKRTLDSKTPNPTYNPYVTVDYLQEVPVQPVEIGLQRPVTSKGKLQPFAAHRSVVLPQLPGPNDDLRHTFGKENREEQPTADRYDWLTHLDRPLVSPLELVNVSGCQPYQLTQRFVYRDTETNQLVKFSHRAPWLDEGRAASAASHRLYRLFEFIEAGPQAAGVAAGGRIPGKVNLNTVWDPEVFRALCDAQRSNHFSEGDVNAAFEQFLYDTRPNQPVAPARRTQGLVPGPNDRPFRSLATGVYQPGDRQFPAGAGNASGVADTFLRIPQLAGAHPHGNVEMLNKIFNHVTTRSNVFAVWLTVGFFEVTDDSTRPVKLGAELGRAENRHVRHRLFALLDRTNLSIASCAASLVTRVTPTPAPQTIPVSALRGTTALSMTGPSVSWNIQPGTTLVVDVGANQEALAVLEVNAAVNPPTITAVFTKSHGLGAALSLPNTPGAPPVFLKPVSVSEPDATGLVTVRVPVDPEAGTRRVERLTGVYDGVPWTIQRGTKLLLDVGPNQEVVTVGRELTVHPESATGTFQAAPARPHPEDVLITNTLLGNPGPRPRFDPRDPTFAAVVRYLSVIH